MLARRLCGQGLSDTGRTEEVDDEPLTLALDKIVEPDVGVVRVDERAKEVLTVCGEHETFKRLVVPFDRTDKLDIELNYQTTRGQERARTYRVAYSHQILSLKLKPYNIGEASSSSSSVRGASSS